MNILRKSIFLYIIYSISMSFGCTTAKLDKITKKEAISPRVAWFMGEVVAEKEGIKRKLALGDYLSAQDIIMTGKTGNVEIMVGEGAIIKVAHDTKISISTLINEQDETATKVNVDFGKVVSVIKKEKKYQDFEVTTPTSIAGVRGTSFITSVERPDGKECSKECSARFAVIEGTIAIKKHGSDYELILTSNTEALIRKDMEFNKSLVRPLNKKSLDKMKEDIVFHKNEVLGYSRLVEELRSSSKELREFEVSGSLEDTKQNMAKIESGKNMADEVSRIAETSDSKYVKKNANKEFLKVEPENSYK